MNRFRIGAVIALLFAAAAFAQTRQPITHEALWGMKRVGTPVPSPDGKWVVFSLTEPAYDEKDVVSDLWIVPSDGSAKPHRITRVVVDCFQVIRKQIRRPVIFADE